MSKDIEDQLEPVTDWLIETVEKSEGFIAEQAPLVAKEILLFARLESIGAVLAFLAATAFAAWLGFFLHRKASDKELRISSPDRELMHGLGFASWALSVLIFAGSTWAWGYAIKCFVAPRLIILEFLKNM